MITMRSGRALPVTALLLLSLGATVTAQSPSPGPTITVIATDYQFRGLPTTVPVGTTLTIDNQGTEFHELLVVRRNDGRRHVLGRAARDAPGRGVPVHHRRRWTGAADRGTRSDGERQHRHLPHRRLPRGLLHPPGSVPGAAPAPDASGSSMGRPHFMLGMRQTFTGTEAGSPVGPPSSDARMAASMGPATP